MIRYPSKSYKKYTMVLLLVTAAALIVCAAALAFKRHDALAVQGVPARSHMDYYSLNQSASQENGSGGTNSLAGSSAPQKSVESSRQEESYLVTVYNGKIGVFRAGETDPFLTADVEVYLLPQQDQELLKKGIKAESFSAVKGILEDYQ